MQWKHIKAEDSVGKRYGMLVVLEVTNLRIRRHIAVRVKCDCGRVGLFDLSQIKAGRINSCGCLKTKNSLKQIQLAIDKNYKTGKWYTDPKIGTAAAIFVGNHYADGDLSFDEFLELSQKNCFYCGTPPCRTSNRYNYKTKFYTYSSFRTDNGNFTYNGLDRIDSTRKHDKENLVTCCWDCNKAKMDRNQKDYILWIEKSYKHLTNIGLLKKE